MAREINMDTLHQNFWAESICKEASLRLRWSRKRQTALVLAGLASEKSTEKIRERRATKLRSFVPKPVERVDDNVKLPNIQVRLNIFGRDNF